MQKCNYCGVDLPENTRFCGKCGNVQDAIATFAATTVSTTPQPPSWAPEGGTILATRPLYSNDPTQASAPAWSPNEQEPATPPPDAENEDERRKGTLLWSPLYGAALGVDALLGSGQAAPAGAPVVQGTPQLGSVPSVSGSPTPSTNAPAGHAAPGAAHAAPVSHPTLGPANTPVSQPLQGTGNAPVGHPVSGPGSAPVSHPLPGPPPRPQPPEPPEPHPPHRPHRHHDHHEHHEVHRATHVTKAAGGSAVKTILIVVTAIVVVAAGGIAAASHFLAHPQPLISISSNYKVGNTPAGANGTILHISGRQFSSNSAITFLLDGHSAPGNLGTRSDANGSFRADVTITSAWSVGTHTLTARDASNDSPQKSVSVTIVQPGQANTPGPNGAPPDDASFRLKVTIGYQVADPFSQNPVLIISGHPDPEGGTVCSPDDSGQSLTFNESAFEGTLLIKTMTATCRGTYKAGQISFIETTTSVTQHWQGNDTCVRNTPTVDLRLTGAYAGNNTFKGTLSSPYFTYTCDQGGNSYHEASLGVPWTGTIVTQ